MARKSNSDNNSSIDQLKNAMKDAFLPEGCSLTREMHGVTFRIAHASKDQYGNYILREGWLVSDVICEDQTRACIQYDHSDVFIDVPAKELVILSCHERKIVA
ncbi:hypothetical protein [Sutterella sp.]|uniref:hypothetical protein n=1 Tax=Sutterella sp. TaxID=1981025 RepID=UPI003FD7B3A7